MTPNEHITKQLIGARRTSEYWKSELKAANARIAELERENERLRSERQVQEAALANLRADLRECAMQRDDAVDAIDRARQGDR